jgi:hypothetical protein
MKNIIYAFAILILSCTGSAPINQHTTNKTLSRSGESISNHFVEYKKTLDSLFQLDKDSLQFEYESREITLQIGPLFNAGTSFAVFRYPLNDTVSNIFVLRHTTNRWDTILSAQLPSFLEPGSSGIVGFEDFNGDGISDLKIVTDQWSYHGGEHAYLWLYQNEHFFKVSGFDTIVSPIYDKSSRLIYAYQSTGCEDMNMYFGVYKIVDNAVKCIKEMTCDCCKDIAKDSCAIHIFGQKTYLVPLKKAYKHIPVYYSEGVRSKCDEY